MALVANYGTDSESENGEEEEIYHTDTRSKNLLTADGDTDSDPESCPNNKIERANKPLPERLPLPMFMNQNETNKMLKHPNSSVFMNPFEEAENEKFSILEKHVKMTHLETNLKNAGKNICHKFRKGRCRFGDKCRFSHTLSKPTDTGKRDLLVPQNSSNTFEHEIPEEEHENVKKQKRKAGLSKTLIPSKKAMKTYERTQANERPWTLNKYM